MDWFTSKNTYYSHSKDFKAENPNEKKTEQERMSLIAEEDPLSEAPTIDYRLGLRTQTNPRTLQ